MSNIHIQPTTDFDLRYISTRLRKADRIEYIASAGSDPEDTLVQRLTKDAQFTAVVDGHPTAVFGCTDNRIWGAPWLLGTDRLQGVQVGLWMVRWGQMFFDAWAHKYQFLRNYTHADNHLHHRYIRLLGAEIRDEVHLTPNGDPFKEFIYRV